MDEILRKRIERKLDGLPEDKAYQVLDYLEFLESKYGTTARQPTPIERITEGVGDTLRAARMPAEAIRGTMNVVDSASRMVERLAAAGRAAVEELKRSTGPAPAPAPAAPPPPDEGEDDDAPEAPEEARPGGGA
ncbi:MAG: hypothetical protein HYV20_06745 [Gemmatimonadetes bacterium]|nr:hypothetical protein [Gemmatimonadota bacterium]